MNYPREQVEVYLEQEKIHDSVTLKAIELFKPPEREEEIPHEDISLVRSEVPFDSSVFPSSIAEESKVEWDEEEEEEAEEHNRTIRNIISQSSSRQTVSELLL